MFCERCGAPMKRESQADTYFGGLLSAAAYQCTNQVCRQIVLYRMTKLSETQVHLSLTLP